MLTQYYLEFELKEKFGEGFELLLIEGYKEFEEDDSILIVLKKIEKINNVHTLNNLRWNSLRC